MKLSVSATLGTAALFCALHGPVLANDSTYTDLDLDKCKTVASDDMGAIMLCSGYKDYQVHFAEGDLRQSVFYGPLDKKWQEQGFESFEPFNHVGAKIEWRLDGSGKPFAAILRWFLENVGPEGEPTEASTGQALVVSRVAQREDGLGCVVGYVDALANPNANEIARKIADEEARNFAGGHQEAVWHGKRGDKASEPTHVFPDGFPQQ
ncbi:hypothetical protein ACO34A_21320 [Rhizobium sp. ACO-34A]|nr:hypothetical protein [Rhizobium sp. ACO-34A]ATN36333.1 hypothetical protein ACO34A_21320 [Rhizobium sp. ACO-34A]